MNLYSKLNRTEEEKRIINLQSKLDKIQPIYAVHKNADKNITQFGV